MIPINIQKAKKHYFYMFDIVINEIGKKTF